MINIRIVERELYGLIGNSWWYGCVGNDLTTMICRRVINELEGLLSGGRSTTWRGRVARKSHTVHVVRSNNVNPPAARIRSHVTGQLQSLKGHTEESASVVNNWRRCPRCCRYR